MLQMSERGLALHIFPVLASVLMTTALIISYAIAVSYDHISVVFPYISDTGTSVPESCIFGQFLNLAAALIGFCVYFWHKQAINRFSTSTYLGLRGPFRGALGLGLASAFGMSVVGNFQETAVWAVHLVGATLLYGCGLIYLLLVTRISSIYTTRRLHVFRVTLCVSATIAAILLPTTGTIARFMYDGKNIRKWQSTDTGYPLHAASSFSEWMVAVCFLVFFITLVYEMKDFTIVAVKIEKTRYKEDEESIETDFMHTPV